ncbi:hypothetical protein LOZ39_006818 [Ophidiomyces ophidiicola]|nr:hypothetical protein LOZ64_006824 [Ophidiomyces ophidiicola]KAI1932010.1 hypothetical protein LOZ62_006731 [Ophidiomyces ophidiicola]KAI1960521.1 hypothetical protein LOZ56_006802 [Ophidiomyces ophidiicola]KAI2015292.1 hypothetical protein LOZ45_006807 [Ophidiomyces ophidiicola]KAI2029681.1 hypothetical protein LOZ47_006706 [Ophidiomyces ophidiicola]
MNTQIPLAMDMNHFIGRRFNLISKSDIRYVGTLHEINPEASTIALENVVSHGTEGRRGDLSEEIAPSTSVYEYIVFRGSDVKDINFADEQKGNEQTEPPQMPNDPAILGTSSRPGPPQSGGREPINRFSHQPRQAPPGFTQPPFPGYYHPYGQRFGPSGFPAGPGFSNVPYNTSQGWYPPPNQNLTQQPPQFPPPQMTVATSQLQQETQPPQVAQSGPISHELPKTTSELPVGEKPVNNAPRTPEAPISGPGMTNLKPNKAPEQAVKKPQSVPHPPSLNTASHQSATASSAVAIPKSMAPPPSGLKVERVVPAIPISTTAVTRPPVPLAGKSPVSAGTSQNSRTTPSTMQEATRAATAAVAAAMAKLPQPSSGENRLQAAEAAVESVTKKVSDMKPFDNERPIHGGQQYSRGGRGYRGAYHPPHPKKIEVPTVDFDFETANAKFNKQDVAKEAIASGSPLKDFDGNGTNDISSTNRQNDTATSSTASLMTSIAYNKSSSFFDNLSSEARDREDGIRRGRRGEEEKKNMETFGQGSVDGGYRGGYRGRGRGRGYRGRGPYGRGYGGRGRGHIRGGRDSPNTSGIPTQTL